MSGYLVDAVKEWVQAAVEQDDPAGEFLDGLVSWVIATWEGSPLASWNWGNIGGGVVLLAATLIVVWFSTGKGRG